MRKSGLGVFVALSVGLAPAGGVAWAQLVPVPVVRVPAVVSTADERVYAELFDVIAGGVDQERMLDQLVATFAQQLATANPDIVKAEAAFPGFSVALSEAVRPVLRSYRARVLEEYRPRTIDIFQDFLDVGEARDAIDVYRSPVGRKILGGVSTGYDGKATMASALRDKDVSEASVRADVEAAKYRAVRSLTQSDLAELERMARSKPVIFKLGELGSRIMKLRVAMENEPLTSAEETELERLINAAGEAHLAKFGK